MKKPPPLLTPRIIADMCSGDECADPDHPGLRVRRTNAARVFFYRYRAHDGALREIKLGEFGPMTLAEARKALGRLKVERERARLLRRELLPRLGDRAAATVPWRELQDEVIWPMLNRAPRCATYLLSRIRGAYAHAAEQGRLPDDFVFPTLGIKGAPQVRR
jgi:hypothetical protein